MRILAAAAAGNFLLALFGQAVGPELDMLERVSQLDSPALLILFVILLHRGTLVWRREIEGEREEKKLWREAALGRAAQDERSATIAESAIRRGRRLRE